MLDKIYQFIGKYFYVLLAIVCVGIIFIPLYFIKGNVVSDKNIQNHLVWSIKGECFFVRPTDELNISVKLIRLEDCDKK
jgi:hypothetical protein